MCLVAYKRARRVTKSDSENDTSSRVSPPTSQSHNNRCGRVPSLCRPNASTTSSAASRHISYLSVSNAVVSLIDLEPSRRANEKLLLKWSVSHGWSERRICVWSMKKKRWKATLERFYVRLQKKRAVLQFAVWKHLVSAQVSDWRKKQRFPKFK